MLELMPINSNSLDGNALPQEAGEIPQDDSCFMDFKEISPELHTLQVKDFIHDLSCHMTLEVKKILVFPEDEGEGYLEPIIACSFRAVNTKGFHEKTGYAPFSWEW